ncbi:MAG: DUF1289 domain-containing protein [Brachymonas sp.]|nr:DUF1289 domain-containing protein [Brachymonas sp.]
MAARAHQALAAPNGHVPSPCIRRCKLDSTAPYCMGCWRSMQEITAWSQLDDAAKRQVWRAIAARSRA